MSFQNESAVERAIVAFFQGTLLVAILLAIGTAVFFFFRDGPTLARILAGIALAGGLVVGIGTGIATALEEKGS